MDAITTAFDLDELNTLAFKINLDYDDLAGETKEAKARELVKQAQRMSLLDALVVACFNERPNMYWDKAVMDVPSDVIVGMIPKMSNGSASRLQGLQMARLEGRMSQVEIGQGRIKALVATSLTANAFLTFMSVLEALR